MPKKTITYYRTYIQWSYFLINKHTHYDPVITPIPASMYALTSVILGMVAEMAMNLSTSEPCFWLAGPRPPSSQEREALVKDYNFQFHLMHSG